MRFEEIDEALRKQATWDPPPGFARKVARMAQQQVDPRVRLLDVLALAPYALRDTVRDLGAHLAGLRWTLRQYWLFVAR